MDAENGARPAETTGSSHAHTELSDELRDMLDDGDEAATTDSDPTPFTDYSALRSGAESATAPPEPFTDYSALAGPTESPLPVEPTPPVAPPEPPTAPAAPLPASSPLRIIALDTSESARAQAEHNAGTELRQDKEAYNEGRLAYIQESRFGGNIFGRIALSTVYAARHSGEFVKQMDVSREFVRQYRKGQLLTGSRHEELQASTATQEATLRRFDRGLTEDNPDLEALIHRDAGESAEVNDRPEVQAFKDQVSEILRDFAAGTIDLAEFRAEKTTLLQEQAPWLTQMRGEHRSIVTHEIDNIERAAVHLRMIFEHQGAMEEIDRQLASMELVTGEARIGARTEAHKNNVDRILEKINETPAGMIANSAVVGTAVAGVYTLATRGVVSGAARVLGAVGVGSAAGGAFAFFRERHAIRTEHSEVMRELATGEDQLDPAAGSRREKFLERDENGEYTRIPEMTSSQELNRQRAEIMEFFPGTMVDFDLNPEQIDRILEYVTSTKSIIAASDTQRVDLIRYSSPDTMEEERYQIDLGLAMMTNVLRQHFADPAHAEELTGFDSLEAMLAAGIQRGQAEQLREIGVKEAAFEKFARNQSLKKAAITVGAGLVIGGIVREAVGAIRSDGGVIQEVHERSVSHASQKLQNAQRNFMGITHDYPKDWNVDVNAGAITDAKGHVIASGLTFEKTGGFSQHSMDILRAKGFHVSQTTELVDGPPTEIRVSSRDLSGMNQEVNRHWMANNTPAPRYDLNELREDISLKNGMIEIKADRMTAGGSFQGGTHVNAPMEFGNRRGEFLASLTKDSQGRPFHIPIGEDGIARIPVDSDQARALFDMSNGGPRYKGAFLEAAVPTGESTNGKAGYNILATVVGRNEAQEVVMHVPQKVEIAHATIDAWRDVATPRDAMHRTVETYFLPVTWRRNLEGPKRPEPIDPGYSYRSYGGDGTSEQEVRARARFSERLRNNPDAELRPVEEIQDYFSREGAETTARVETLAQQVEQPMGAEVEAVVAIPVAGHQEGRNIYRTLSWYTAQVGPDGQPLDPSRYEIVLNVNKPADAEWDETPAEIERFRREHPEVPIRVIQTEFAPGSFAIGQARKDLVDTTLLRQLRRGTDRDIAVISNDADVKGIGRGYISAVLDGAQGADAVAGRLEYDPQAIADMPFLGTSVQVMQMLDVLDRHPRDGRQPRYNYCGANFAVRASMLAAIGGYEADASLAEDVALGNAVSLARRGGSKPAVAFQGGDDVVYTSTRRAEAALASGEAAAAQWSIFNFGSGNDEIRRGVVKFTDPFDYDVLLQDITPETPEKERQNILAGRQLYVAALEDQIERTLSEYRVVDGQSYLPGMPETEGVKAAERMIESLRLDGTITVTDGKPEVKVASADRYFAYLRALRGGAKTRAFAARTGAAQIFGSVERALATA